MSLIIQSAGDSIRESAATGRQLSVAVPPALTAGDILVFAISARQGGAITYDGETDSQLTLHAEHVVTDSGSASIFFSTVPTSAAATTMKEVGQASFSALDGTNDYSAMTGFAFRLTGGDETRLIEEVHYVEGNLPADGELFVGSFDPEYRIDNAVLGLVSAGFAEQSTVPVIAATGAAPVGVVTTPMAIEGETAEGVTTGLMVRPLTSADPTGVSRISFSAQPTTGFGLAVMLRSKNQPPVISLAEEWVAEIGREAVISATITDPDQTPVSFAWSQAGGPEKVSISNIYSRAFSFTPFLPGIYTFTLRATDVDGGATEMETRVIVPTGTSGPTAVIASAGWTDQNGRAIEPIELGDDDDTTFARTENLPVGDPLTVRLPPVYGGAAITLTIRGAATNPSPALRRTVTLRQADGVVIAERSYALPTALTSYVFTTTKGETALITNRSEMTVTIVDEVA